MACHALADYQNHVIGWLQWEQSSLGDGALVRFPRIWMSSGECRLIPFAPCAWARHWQSGQLGHPAPWEKMVQVEPSFLGQPGTLLGKRGGQLATPFLPGCQRVFLPGCQRVHEIAPRGLGRRQRPPVFASRLCDMAVTTQHLQVVRVVDLPAGPERPDMVHFHAPNFPALAATPAVAGEHGPAHGRPAARVQVDVVSAQVLLYDTGIQKADRAGRFRTLFLAEGRPSDPTHRTIRDELFSV